MTQDDLDRLKELARRATEGPWKYVGLGNVVINKGLSIVSLTHAKSYNDLNSAGSRQVDIDYEFIAAARTAIPELIAEVEWLWVRVAELEQRAFDIYNEATNEFEFVIRDLIRKATATVTADDKEATDHAE